MNRCLWQNALRYTLLTFSAFVFFVGDAWGQPTTEAGTFHRTFDQRTIGQLFFAPLSGTTSTAQWTVFINGSSVGITVTGVSTSEFVGVFGPTATISANLVAIQFDASGAAGHSAATPYLLPGEVLTISFNNIGNTLLTASNGAPIVAFGPKPSVNSVVPSCATGDIIFNSEGVASVLDQCSPVNSDFWRWTYQYSLRFRNSTAWNTTNNRLHVLWGSGASNNDLQGYLSDNGGNPNTNFITNTFTGGNPGVFLSFRPGLNLASLPAINVDGTNGFTYPDNTGVCNFRTTHYPFGVTTAAYSCTGNPTLERNTQFNSYDFDDQNTGSLVLNPIAPPASGTTTSDLVCLGTNVGMRFVDASVFNCIGNGTVLPVPGQGAVATPVNNQQRWIRFIYGGIDNTVTGQGNIRDIRVNGTQVTDGTTGVLLPAYNPNPILAGPLNPTTRGFVVTGGGGPSVPDANGVIELPANATASAILSSLITTLSTLNHAVDQRFYVTLQYWNVCNPYPTSAPVEINVDFVQIITTPNPPTVPSRDICESPAESRQLSVSPTVVGLTYKWYLTQADALANINVQATNANFTPTAAQAPAGQRKHFFVTATAGNGCISQPTEVTLTVRPTLAQPPVITGSVNLCPSSNYIYTLPSPPSSVTITDAITGNFVLTTEYQWTVPAAVGSINLGQGTESLTITSAAAVGSGSISVINRYVTPPATTSGSQCNSTSRPLTVNVRARPTGNITPDPVNLCEGSTQVFNGNPSLPAAAAGFTPAILNHTWAGSPGILDAVNVQQPNLLTTVLPGTYGLTYVVTADFGNSVTCSSVADVSTVNISANTAPAATGANQLLCGTLVSNPMGGSNPAPGTGTWTFVSSVPVRPAPTISNINAQNATITIAAGNEGAYRMRWTVVSGTCTSQADIIVDLGSDPTNPAAGLDQFVCAESTALAGNTPIIGSGLWSVVSGPGGCTVGCPITITTPTAPNSGVTLNGPGFLYGAYTLRWTITSGTCPSEQDDIIITFNRAATVSAIGDFSFCLNSGAIGTPIPLTGTVGGGATQGLWERVIGNGTIQSSGGIVGNAIAGPNVNDFYIPSAADFAAGSITVQLVALDPDGAGPTGPCVALQDQVFITKDLSPSAAIAGGNFETCDPVENLGATPANNGGTGTWTVGGALYYETFPTTDNGLGITGPTGGAANFNHPGGNWSASVPAGALLDNTDFIRVNAGAMVARDVSNLEVVWQSSLIPITGSVNVSADITEVGTQVAGDYIRVFYKIDGGPEVLFGAVLGDLVIDGQMQTVTATTPAGTTVQIVMRARNDGTPDEHRLDNVLVSPAGSTLPVVADIHDPASAVSNLQVGVNNFTWTVRSALGVCGSSNSSMTITRHASPAALDPLPELCEDALNPAQATVTAAYLASALITDGVTGIVNSTNRTVQYFTDALRTISVPDPYLVSNNDVIYTRVTRTDVTPQCVTDGIITFKVNLRPAALNQNPEFCEELPVGSNTRTGINLTTFDNPVKNNVPANSVAWFSDASLLIPVPVPTSVTANNGTSFFARVTDTKGCTKDAEVDITLNPIPGPNALLGPTDVCADPTAVTLYQLSVNNVGYSYTWSIPDPPFDRIIGGTAADFLVLLSFPVVVNPGQNISVIETSNKGCVGLPNSKTIKVDTSPPAITILDDPGDPLSFGPGSVCEGEAGVVYTVANLANTTYAWTVPPGSSIIGGQGTFQITVNFGTIPGLISVVPTTTTGCAGNPDDYSVAINPRPSLNTSPNTVCSDDLASITLSGIGATSFNITNVSVPPGLSPASRPFPVIGAAPNAIFNDVFTNTTGGNLIVQYSVVPVSGLGCEGAAQIVNLTIRPEPVLAPNLNDEICSTTDAVGIVLSVASGSFPADQYVIASINNPSGLTQIAGTQIVPGTYASGILLDDKWENLTGAPATIEYLIHPRNSGTTCLGDPAIPVIVTVNPEPIISPMAPETICSGDTPTTTISPSIPGSTFNWTGIVTGLITGNTTGSGPFGTAITDVLINNGGAGFVTYSITATGPGAMGSCTGQPRNLVVNVNPSPTAISINRIECSDTPGGNTFFIDLTTLQNTVNSGGGVTFTWYSDLALTTLIAAPTAHTMTSGVPVYVNVDNGQCTKVATVLFTINPKPSVTASIASPYNGFQLSCNGASDGQITAVPANGTGPYLFSINGGASFFTTPTFNGLSVAGNNYVVRVRDSNGCINDSPPLTIVPPTAVSATRAITSNFNGEDVSCQTASDGEITISPTGGTGAGTYTFRLLELPSNTTGDASGVYNGLRAGVYTFVVKDANNCQFTTPTITVTEPSPVTATATLTSPVTCNGNSNGVITVVASGGTLAGPNYSFTLNQPPSTTNATGIFNGLAAGNYTVNVKDDNNCLKTSNVVSVTQPSVLTAFASVTSNYNGAKISCVGANDGQVTAISNGGNGGFSYVLDQDLLNLTGAADGSFENLGPGTYTITVTDAGTCIVTSAAVTVTEPTLIVGSALVTGTISCNGGNDGQITVSGSGGTGAYSFEQLSPAGPINATGIFPGLSQGSYDFEVSDLNGCTDAVTLPISQPALVTASASVTSNYNGSQITCTGASNGVITVNGSGGTGSLTYIFDQFALSNTTGQFSGVFIGVPANAGYTFTVKDSKNCTVVTTPITITPPTAVAASGSVTSNYTGEDIRCVGSSDGQITITSSGGTGTRSYKLDQVPANTSGDVSGIYTGLSAGTYTVTSRDLNNCFIVTAPITITPPPGLTGSALVTSSYAGGRQITCNGASDGRIQVSGVGGVGGFTYQFNEISGNISGAATGIFTGIPAGTYTFTITDANTCQRLTTPITITDPAVLTAGSAVTSNYNGEQISCNGASDGRIRITPTGGTSTYTFASVQFPGNMTGATTGIFTGLAAGSYTFNVVDLNLCPVTTAPIIISEPTALTVSRLVDAPYNGQQISCNGVDDATITVTRTGGTGAVTYVFDQFALTNLSGKFSGIFSGIGAGTNYTFTATDINGCPVTSVPVNVVQPAAISATLNATSNFNGFDISCFNLTDGVVSVIAPAGGTGAFTYLLLENPGNVTGQTTGVFQGLRAGSYRVRITDQNFCQFLTAPIPVIQPTDINVEINISSNYNGSDISCAGASDGAVSVTTIAGGATATGVTYVLDQSVGNTTGQASGVFTGLVSGLYTITAKDANNCTKVSLPVVMLDPLPLFEGIVGLDKSVCVGANPSAFTELAAAFGGIGNYAYQWQESSDGVTFGNVAGATNAIFDPPVIPITTFYKRRITSGTCATLESNTVKVTVNPLPTATLVPSKSPVCEGDFFLLNFTFTGQAPFYFDYDDNDPATPPVTPNRLGAATTPVPILNYANTTTYTLTRVQDFNGCVATVLPAPVTVPVIKINPNFAITSPTGQCSGGQFDFTFTIDPNTDYTWIWGDGQTDLIAANSLPAGVHPISHIYNSFNTSGTTSFPVILTAINNVNGCGPKQTNQSIQIYPNILISLFPDKTEICGGDEVTFTNPTAGGTTHHWFYREKGVVEKRDERTFVAASTQAFTFNNTTTQNPIIYELVYEVSNANCADVKIIEITVYREVAASFSRPSLLPFFIGGNANLTFTNTSVPVNGTEFEYEWDFGNGAAQIPVNGIGPFNFNYIAPGTKTVRLTATNLVALANGLTCSSVYQETFNILVPPLVAGFEYTPQAVCFPSNIQITRNLATGNTFEWRLVDGNGRQLLVTNDTLPKFLISSPGRYTIFQSTKNTQTGQTATADNSAPGNNAAPYNMPIDIYEAPFAGFEARPTIIYVPDTQLQTFNFSSSPSDPLTAVTYPIEYRWYFGDGTDTLSTADDAANFEPSHFYQNEGSYDIALLAVNKHDNGAVCVDTATQRIQAKAAGFTRVPNAFTPSPSGPTGGVGSGGNSVNDVFLPVAKGIVDFQMQIFDRWGNLIFESKNKTIGWDGYDKNGNLLPAGVYVYKLVLRLSNDQRTTQIGDVTLIR